MYQMCDDQYSAKPMKALLNSQRIGDGLKGKRRLGTVATVRNTIIEMLFMAKSSNTILTVFVLEVHMCKASVQRDNYKFDLQINSIIARLLADTSNERKRELIASEATSSCIRKASHKQSPI